MAVTIHQSVPNQRRWWRRQRRRPAPPWCAPRSRVVQDNHSERGRIMLPWGPRRKLGASLYTQKLLSLSQYVYFTVHPHTYACTQSVDSTSVRSRVHFLKSPHASAWLSLLAASAAAAAAAVAAAAAAPAAAAAEACDAASSSMTAVWRRQLNMKAKFESGLSYFTFKS